MTTKKKFATNEPGADALGDEGLIGLDNLYHFVPLHRAHIHKLVRRGEFPKPLKLGRRTVFRRKEIRDWLSRFD